MLRLIKISVIVILALPNQLFSQSNGKAQIDTSIYSSQNITIQNKIYNGFLTSEGFKLMDSKEKIYLNHPGDYFTWTFKDFDEDGHKDIYLDKGGNIPERFDLLLYVPALKSFRQIKDFDHFPAPEKISKTKYYYSYHKSGCADNDWDSDLFYIDNFKAIRLGNIEGRGCEINGIKDSIYIYKIQNKNKKLFTTLPIDTIQRYKNLKWGFIKEYWIKNYTFFL